MEFDNDILEIFIQKKIHNDEGDKFSDYLPYGEVNIEDVMRASMKHLKDEIKRMPPGSADEKNRHYLLILRYESALREYKEKKKEIDKLLGKTIDENDIIGTARQSSIAFYYILKTKNLTTGDDSKDGRFTRFLSGHSLDTMRKTYGNRFRRPSDKTGNASKKLLSDFILVKKQFEKIQFIEGLQLIEKDIKTLQNDIDSFELI